MSDTPRTDAAAVIFGISYGEMDVEECPNNGTHVPVELARELERDNAALRADNARLVDLVGDLVVVLPGGETRRFEGLPVGTVNSTRFPASSLPCASSADNARLRDLVSALDDYIALLGAECSDLAVMASLRGWKSSRVNAGDRARARIDAARAALAQTEDKQT